MAARAAAWFWIRGARALGVGWRAARRALLGVSMIGAGLVGAAWAGCASTGEAFAPPPNAVITPGGEVGLAAGETMSFVVKLAGLEVGEAALAVGEVGDFEGRPAITVRSKIGTTGAARMLRAVDDEATTVIDLGTGAPLRLATHVTMAGKETFTNAVFAPGVVRVEVRRSDSATARPYSFAFGDVPALDAHAAMAQLRGWRPTRGAGRTVWLVGGRRLWRVDLTYLGKDTIGTEQGNRATTRLEGVAYRVAPDRRVDTARPPRRFTVWMSDDADRVPLRVSATTELGAIDITLVEYQRR